MGYPGDRLLVICDGIVEAMDNNQVAKFVHTQLKINRHDPAQVMRDLLFHSLSAGSKDNHSGILVVFEDGTGYERPDVFKAGPVTFAEREDAQFVTQYKSNAESWGVTGAVLEAKIREANETMPHDWRTSSKSPWPEI